MSGIPNVPGRRRAIPKPFQRPSVSVASADVKREWQSVEVLLLATGDTVVSHGTIKMISKAHGKVRVWFPECQHIWDDTVVLFAFTKVLDGNN